MLELIKLALMGLASIPKILEYLESLNLAIRLDRIEKNQAAIKDGFDQLAKAKTPNEIQNAATAVSAAWNKFS
ncbi:hypothetical protein EBZ38_16420 [bacterium]|jgi:hypothetical protein|nr:hypothetical protein [bacterium]NDD85846.1 hypothetical protein [bacterium]NDG27854.1 hypothetical protein [Pseudomonadota bacterium]